MIESHLQQSNTVTEETDIRNIDTRNIDISYQQPIESNINQDFIENDFEENLPPDILEFICSSPVKKLKRDVNCLSVADLLLKKEQS
jgi:hypothetical protein